MAEHGVEIESNEGTPPVTPAGTTVSSDGSIVSPEMNAQKPPASKILGKFNSHEDLEKAYVELEKKLGSRAPVIAPKEETPTETPPKVEDKKQEEAPPAKTPEELDDEQRAAAALVRAEMAEVVGGDAHLDKVLEWAQKNLSKEEAEFYNKAVAADDKAAVKMALRGIAASYERAFPAEPVTPTAAAASRAKPAVKPFANKSEMYSAIGDARYAEDPTYRRSVEARIMASPW